MKMVLSLSKNIKSKSKNSCDLFTAITYIKILVEYLFIIKK